MSKPWLDGGVCFKCEIEKSSDQFYKRHRQCKGCYRDLVYAYRAVPENKARLAHRTLVRERAQRLALTVKDYEPTIPSERCSICGVAADHPRNGTWRRGETVKIRLLA